MAAASGSKLYFFTSVSIRTVVCLSMCNMAVVSLVTSLAHVWMRCSVVFSWFHCLCGIWSRCRSRTGICYSD